MLPSNYIIGRLLLLLPFLLTGVKCRKGGPYYIQSVANCQFLDVLNGVKCAGGKVITSPLGPKKTQKWMISCAGDSVVIINCFNGLALDIEGGGLKKKKGPPDLVLWPVNKCANQRWIFDCNGVIRSKMKNLALDVCNPKKGRPSLVGVYPKHSKVNQKFKLIPADCCGQKSCACCRNRGQSGGRGGGRGGGQRRNSGRRTK